MKKWIKWLLITIGVILIGIIAYFIYKDAIREEAVLTFPDTVIVQNATEYQIDIITKAVAHHVLGYDTINVALVMMPKQMEEVGDIDIKAYLQKNIFQEHAYLIFLSSTLRPSEYKMVISHEFAHVAQMENGDLIQMELGVAAVVYKGDTINFYDVPYKQRQHEKDANKHEDQIYRNLDKVLYK